MSAKWRSLQHRHKYTYTSVVFPKSYTESLDRIASDTSNSSNFFSEVKLFASLSSTYAQLDEVKKLASAFTNLLADPQISDESVSTAARFYLETLFLENSLPLHRTLISALNKCRKFHHVISNCFATLCEEYGNLGKKEKKRFLVSRATLSLIGYPKLGILDEIVEKCSDRVAMDVVFGLESVLVDVSSGSRPSPVVMEQCQDAMSCMYYLLQRYPSKFVNSENSSNIFRTSLSTILSVLNSTSFSRDCLVASAVSFCAAIQAFMGPRELSTFISSKLFGAFSDENSDEIICESDLIKGTRDLSFLSRLCLLRGILTAIPREVLNTNVNGLVSTPPWTILYSGVLPELCSYCENPIDSHFNFHALTVTQICLQQIKTSLLSDLTIFSNGYEPFSEDVKIRLLRIIWNNLEDPLSQTVKQVHLMFDLLLDIESSLPFSKDNGTKKAFFAKVGQDLLCLGPRCKGRYVPLASLTRRLGANSLLNFNSNLLFETAYAYIDDDVCCAATSFLKCFLESLRDECWSEYGIEKGYEAFRSLSLPPIMQGLVSGHSKLRTNLNTYALPAILDVDIDSIFPMLEFISVGPGMREIKLKPDLKLDQCVTALVSLLKVSRTMALIEGDIDFDPCDSDHTAVILVKGVNVRVPVRWFVLSLMHCDDSVRIDAAESLFLNPKTSSLPSTLELKLMQKVIPLNMRCSSTAFQMKWTSLFRKFFSRVRTALERQVKQGTWIPGSSTDDGTHKAEDLFQFMNWLSRFLFYSCYPSAPYERKTTAMELILTMIEIWPINTLKQDSNYLLCPYGDNITSPDSTISLVGSIVDSWDRLREHAFHILFCFPTPLPGICENDSIDNIIRWAKKLVHSPRVRESDAGALTLRLIFKKYVLGLGCNVKFSTENNSLTCVISEVSKSTGNPVIGYISSLVDWLHSVVEEGERDLTNACKKSFVHGILLTLRYTFEELDWGCEAVQLNGAEMRAVVERLLGLIVRITSLALWVVSADVWSMPYDMDDSTCGDDVADVFLQDGFAQEEEEGEEESELERELVETDDTNGKPAEHIVMVGCWLAMKEVSLLFGTIIRKVPLPSCASSIVDEEQMGLGTEILDLAQLETMGNHFLQVLLKMKHNGAIDKTRAGFTALCNRLLCSNDSRLCKMTESWMELLMERTISKEQTVDDLLRRSAGIPAAFLALFLAEPEGTPKKLLPKALQWLIDLAKKPLSNCAKLQSCISDTSNKNLSKTRDEGVIPTVHAFNVLRAAFNDANLATDTSGFSAEAMILSIRSFSSPYWEVRNAATLAYTALLRRMVGFLNVHKRESARRSLTGLEFFHRYPALHPFLSEELKIATDLLDQSSSTHHAEPDIIKAIHPSLCPILILLSRLKPSPLSGGSDETLDPFSLSPFIQRCATQSNFKIRVLASRALTGLVSNEKLHEVTTNVSAYLAENQMVLPFNTIHGLLLQLCSLLDSNCRSLTDLSEKDRITSDITRVLSTCSWLGNGACHVVASSYLRVLNLLLDISQRSSTASKVTATVLSLLFEVTSKHLDREISKELGIMHDPTLIELREQATVSYFGCLSDERCNFTNEEVLLRSFGLTNTNLTEMPQVEIHPTQLQERILFCVTDYTYEVRVATMKQLLRMVNRVRPGDEKGVFYKWAINGLQFILMDRLYAEENPKCVYYMLKIIFSWSLQFKDPFVADSLVFPFWDRLVQLNNTVLRSKTKEIIICCMSTCMKCFVKLLNSSISSGASADVNLGMAIEAINLFVKLVKGYSDPSQPVNMRKAASEAIIASSLLDEATLGTENKSENRSVVKLVLDLWFVSIQLLEDEDVSLRLRLAKYVQKIIAGRLNNDDLDDSTPTQVDKVIELSFEFLSSEFGNWLEYLNCLAQRVLDTSIYANSRGDLVRQIFDKEIDNHHEEKLLICQICCANLEKLVVSYNSKEIQLFAENWRRQFLQHLVLFVSGYADSGRNIDWIGGIGNHKDVFIAVYAYLLGIYALSPKDLTGQLNCINKIYPSESSELSIIGPFLGNPLIYNLYSLVVRDQQKSSFLDGFDPYFLLR
ncbi:hypothetical protein LUZ61_009424 [Rhynchospora tenuis]|uniref:DUF2428 domain-containing protein n=1 Tax=Rhynchospora tenuis TaxID=198213 RepID=A0AAD5ZXI4_9POAL|nr:hypothetical protein LUZ61_009424 [Rhynchospora tenuis]